MTTIGTGTTSPYFTSSSVTNRSSTSAGSQIDFSETPLEAASAGTERKNAVFKGLDTTASNVKRTWELPDDVYQRIVDGMQAILEADYRQFPEKPDLSNYPATQPYASITVGGKIVATIDNQGGVSTDGPLGDTLRDILIDSVNGTNGPDLAQARAEQIARLVGGNIEKSDTAITQSDFNALPPFEAPKPTVDITAMVADSRYAGLQELQQMRQSYLAQQFASTGIFA